MYLPTLGLLLTSLALSNAAALGRRTWSDSNIHVRDDWSPVNTTFVCQVMNCTLIVQSIGHLADEVFLDLPVPDQRAQLGGRDTEFVPDRRRLWYATRVIGSMLQNCSLDTASQIPDGLAANVSLAGPSDGKCRSQVLWASYHR